METAVSRPIDTLGWTTVLGSAPYSFWYTFCRLHRLIAYIRLIGNICSFLQLEVRLRQFDPLKVTALQFYHNLENASGIKEMNDPAVKDYCKQTFSI
jgi:hypothetical protein